MNATSPPDQDRFWSKVARDSDDGCWLWTAGTDSAGYGSFAIRTENGWTKRGAHRIAFVELVGPIPDGLELDHLCRVINCVNPAHLEPVEPRTNKLRGIGFSARNARKTSCAHGHTLGDAYIEASGARRCRSCRLAQVKERRQRKAAA